MSNQLRKISLLMLMAGLFTLQATSLKAQTKKAKDAQVTQAEKDRIKANADYEADVARYRKITEQKIAANKKSMKEFEVRIEKEKMEAKAEYKKKIADLEAKNNDLKKRLEDYKADGNDNWQKFKVEFNHDMNELGTAFKDLTVRNTKTK